jgi:hypothetical protein
MTEKQVLNLKIRIKEKSKNNGLFDYNLKSRRIKLIEKVIPNDNAYIIKQNFNNFYIINNLSEFNSNGDNQILFHLRKSLKNNCYEIINPIMKCNQIQKHNEYIDDLNNKFWYIIGSKNKINEENDENYVLNENDIIKLGEKKYEVTKIRINKADKNHEGDIKSENYNISEINKKAGSIFKFDIKKDKYKIENKNSEKEDEQCWICLESSSTSIDNPLINICKCKNKFVHYLCLKQYLYSKTIIRNNYKNTVSTYCCNKFNCDMCLTPYPTRFKISEFNKEYELIDLNMPEGHNYMILESLDFIKEKDNRKDNIKRIHIIEFNEEDNEIFIGRNGMNDVIDEDLTVSRNHAILRYNHAEEEVVLENRSETYGTLVLIKGNIKMKAKNLNLQIGNSFITVNLAPKEKELM